MELADDLVRQKDKSVKSAKNKTERQRKKRMEAEESEEKEPELEEEKENYFNEAQEERKEARKAKDTFRMRKEKGYAISQQKKENQDERQLFVLSWFHDQTQPFQLTGKQVVKKMQEDEGSI
jgi:hypothetical protein